MYVIKETESLCPECLRKVPATIYVEDGKVYLEKTCKEHGRVKDLYWGDYDQYVRAQNYEHFGTKLDNPRTEVKEGCPNDCGICPDHKSSTLLGIIDVTNRCNLRCPICFAHAGAAGYVYEPSVEQIREMMANLLSNAPIWTPAIQFSGGEPTVRDDLPELVEMAIEMGFVHVEVNSNGIRMAESVEYCRRLKVAGVSTVYLQFDGVTPEPYFATRGHDLLPIKMRAIRNLREAGFRSIVLVPVLVRGVNDHQVGDIIRFAIENREVIRGVNFQPVAITGRVNERRRDEMRITIPDLIRLTEEQTRGFIREEDWYPIPSVLPICEFLSEAKDEPFVDFGVHPHCGMATYLYMDGDRATPIPRIVNVDDSLRTFEETARKLREGKGKRANLGLVMWLIKNVRFKTFRNYLRQVILHSDYLSLNLMHHEMILIGAMHFMDPYNFDIERVQRCGIHYATPEGTIIPFCTMNNLHRQRIEGKYSRPLDDGELTPLHDIKALTAKILEEDRVEQFREFVAPVHIGAGQDAEDTS